MAFGMLRSVIATQVANRLDDQRTGAALRWSNADIDAAIGQAILLLQPLGDESVLTMTAVQYAATTQTPASSVLGIKRVEADNAVGKWTEIRPSDYMLQRQASNWLFLSNAPATGETIRIHAITSYDPDATTITADPECVITYALSLLYEQKSTFGQTGSRQDDMQKALDYRSVADVRKETLVNQMYPQIQPATPAHAAAPRSKKR